MTDILFATRSYKSRSLPVSAQRCVNAYAEGEPPDAKTAVAVFGVPGIDTFATCGNGPVRGGVVQAGIPYFVSGQSLYTVDSAGTETVLGSGISGNGVVGIAASETEIIVVNGTSGWTYNPSTTTFAQITDGDFEVGNSVTYINGYFLVDWAGTNKFTHSDLLDGTSWSALAFATAESSSDRVVSVINNQGVLCIFGESTIEFWDHTGALSFPFQPLKGATPDRGIAAPLARARQNNTVFFLGNDLVFYRLNGLTPVPVSEYAQSNAWEQYTTTSDAFCFAYDHDGHKFVVLTFPSEGKTWEYDTTTGLWHERISWDASGSEVKWRINCAVEAYGKTLVGDANSGKIGFIDPNTYTEFGDPIRMIMVSPPVHGKGLKTFMPFFHLDVESGVGLASGQGSDPQYMLDYSDDGGRTFSPAQIWKSAGKIGKYRTRLQWDRLGQFEQRVLRVQCTDPVKRVVLAARCPRLKVGMD